MTTHRPARWRYLLLLILAGLAVVAYIEARPFISYPVTTISGSLATPLPEPAPAVAMAGIAMRDITTPIGIPKFGYSAFAKQADGFRTRLKARAFYLRATTGEPMALVQLDLGSGSLVLQQRVAELIARDTDIPAHALSLLVTHTHNGPGGYLGSNFYNVFGANKPGFEPQVFEFLSRQIADAVIEAYQQRRPARFAVGQREVWGLTRNRSLAAWANNHDLPDSALTDDLALRAINPRMTMLRIDQQASDGAFYPAGALTAFSIHGTTIPGFSGPYHGDLWTYLSIGLEQQIAASGSPFVPVHGPFQGTHGDNSPAWYKSERGDLAARRIGHALADSAATLWRSLGTNLSAQLNLASGSRLIDISALQGDARQGLCQRPVVGAATVGAANGDEVFPISYLPFLAENWPRRWFTDGCHGVKQWMFSRAQMLLPARHFPHKALFQVLQINDWVLATAPWEVTLEAGNRIRQAVSDTLPPGRWLVEVSSLANGLFGYVTTAEEYALQYYEGGHNLYGPKTIDFIQHSLASLSADLQAHGSVRDLPQEYRFDLISRSFWPSSDTPPGKRQWLTAAEFFPAELPHVPFWQWSLSAEQPAYLALHQPLLQIVDDQGQIVDDDQSGNLEWRLLSERQDDATQSQARYQIRWYYPQLDGRRQYRLVVAARPDQPVLLSPWFPSITASADNITAPGTDTRPDEITP